MTLKFYLDINTREMKTYVYNETSKYVNLKEQKSSISAFRYLNQKSVAERQLENSKLCGETTHF